MSNQTNIIKYIESFKGTLEYNKIIFDILEGDLATHLRKALALEFKPKNLEDAMTRANPTNVLRKVVSKLSRLYLEDPTRTTDSPVNQELINDYVLNEDLNFHWSNANTSFNGYKNTALELYHDPNNKRLRTRSIPSTSFLPRSTNIVDPLEPTEIIKIMGKDANGDLVVWVYSNEEFYRVGPNGDKLNITLDGIENPYGIIPVTYINQSSYTLVPTVDTDTVRMAILVGKLLTDQNFSAKYNANPIVYGIDMEIESLERSPNIFWNLKSSEDKKPEIGVVKPDSDMQGMMNSLMQQVALWLQTKDIRPGTVGDVGASGDRAASGLSLMIQEMDTAENVNKQKRYFEAAENDYWKRLGVIHNYLADAGLISTRVKFQDPEKMSVGIEYPQQRTIEDKTVVENRVLAKLESGVISKKKAIEELYPKMNEQQVLDLLAETSKEGAINFGEIQA